jgi:ferritin-like metal-binding protein YciE
MIMRTTFEAFLRAVAQLSDAKWQFVEVEEEMVAIATNPALAQLLQQHLDGTTQQRSNLDRIISLYREQDLPVTSHGARGIARDLHESLEDTGTTALTDWLIAQAARTILHAEIAYSANLLATARGLGLSTEALAPLQQNLEQDLRRLWQLEELAPQILERSIQEPVSHY